METPEKVGLGLAVAVMGGLLLLFATVDTGPETHYTPAQSAAAPAEQVAVITRGEAVDLAALLPASGRTVVEFTAEW